eukprot:10492936-Alexandrium_andersonii.AAC.1
MASAAEEPPERAEVSSARARCHAAASADLPPWTPANISGSFHWSTQARILRKRHEPHLR